MLQALVIFLHCEGKEGYDGSSFAGWYFLWFSIVTEIAASSNNFIIFCIAQVYKKMVHEYFTAAVYFISVFKSEKNA